MQYSSNQYQPQTASGAEQNADERTDVVRNLTAASGDVGQRIDNFLLRVLRGVPRGHVYRLLRRGEVRVNGRRTKPTYRLADGDRIRLPPVQRERHAAGELPPHLLDRLRGAIRYEDERLLVVDKPEGIAVHAGSGLGGGVIDGLRALRPDVLKLSLVHRLDRDTSGCLLVAKDRRTLRALQDTFRSQRCEKSYQAVLTGDWSGPDAAVDAPLTRDVRRGNERVVRVDRQHGRTASSRFHRLAGGHGLTRVAIAIATGRTHQIRVHARHLGFPVLGDPKYGNRRQEQAALGRKPPRLFLHAHRLRFPLDDEWFDVTTPVPELFIRIAGSDTE